MVDPTASGLEPRRLTDREWERIEAPITAFEAAWVRGERPLLGDYLAADSLHRQTLLVELVHAELEFRLKAGEPARVETYLTAFPDLATHRDVVMGLVRAEWSIRGRLEAKLGLDHYVGRFPTLAEELASRPIVPTPSALGPSPAISPIAVGFDADPLPRWLGKYELRQQVGCGGFGFVYRAWDSVLDRDAAVKIPRPEVAASALEVANFLREARNAITLRHPNIVEIYDAGPIDRTVCLVSEFVEGMTLAERLRIGAFGVFESVRIMKDVLGALGHAHDRKIIHRDLKPSNILLDRQGKPHLTDFGLAKRAAGDSTLSPTGAAQVLIGTPAYMAPEQARGDTASVDARSDIYSAGVLLYELLTGGVPFRGRGRILQVQIEEAAPISPRNLNDEVSPDLEMICLKALAKHPAERYQTTGAMIADLDDFEAGRPIAIQLGGDPLVPGRRRLRLRRSAATLAVLVLLIAAGARWLVLERLVRSQERLIESIARNAAEVAELPFLGGTDPADEHRRMVDAIWGRIGGWLATSPRDPGLGEFQITLLIRSAEHAAAVGFDPDTRRAWRGVVAAIERRQRDHLRAHDRSVDLARAYSALGKLDADGGLTDDARRNFKQAAGIWDELARRARERLAAAPDSGRLRLELAEALLAAEEAGRSAQVARTTAGVEEAAQLVGRVRPSPDLGPDDLLRLFRLQVTLARRSQALGNSPQARRWGRSALQTASPLQAAHVPANFAIELARTQVMIAQGMAADDPFLPLDEGAVPLCREAIEGVAAASRLDPLDLELARTWAFAEANLASILARRGQRGEAIRTLRAALDRNDAIRRARPRSHVDLGASAAARVDLGRFEADAGRTLPAIGQLVTAFVYADRAAALAPGVDAYRRDRARSAACLAHLVFGVSSARTSRSVAGSVTNW